MIRWTLRTFFIHALMMLMACQVAAALQPAPERGGEAYAWLADLDQACVSNPPQQGGDHSHLYMLAEGEAECSEECGESELVISGAGQAPCLPYLATIPASVHLEHLNSRAPPRLAACPKTLPHPTRWLTDGRPLRGPPAAA